MKYDLLIFDLDGTLFDYRKSERTALLATARKMRFKVDEEFFLEKYRELNGIVWREFEKGLLNQDVLKRKRFQLLLDFFQLDGDIIQVSDLYLQFLGETAFLLPGAEKILTHFSNKAILSIMTNGLKNVQYSRLDISKTKRFFDYIVISEEVGVQKPDPGIFKILWSKLHKKIDKSRALMIGDSLSSDIQGGAAFGIDTCWMNWEHEKNDSSIRPDYEICSLEEITHIVC